MGNLNQEGKEAVESTAEAIRRECRALEAMLLDKNAKYGDSALAPLRVFSRSDAGEGIRVRLDDKLSRIARGDGSGDEDAGLDLMGYLVLLRIAEARAGEEGVGSGVSGLADVTGEQLEAWCRANPEVPVRVILESLQQNGGAWDNLPRRITGWVQAEDLNHEGGKG